MTTGNDASVVGDTELFCHVCTEERGIDLQTLEQTIRTGFILRGPILPGPMER